MLHFIVTNEAILIAFDLVIGMICDYFYFMSVLRYVFVYALEPLLLKRQSWNNN
jgi:hypothetical protein